MSGGALEVGKLYVSLAADTSQLLKGVADGMKAVQKFAADVKKVTAAATQVTGAMSAMAAGALALAATVDGPSKQAMDGLKAATTSLAVETSKMLLPAVRELTSIFREAARWVAGLSPELKAHISHFAVLAVGVGAVAAVMSSLLGILGPLAGLFSSLAAALAGVSVVGLLEVLAVVGLVAGAVVFLHKAWRENWGGMQQVVHDVAQYFSDVFGQSTGTVKKLWTGLLSHFQWMIGGTIDTLDRVQKAFGVKLFDAAGLKEGFAGLFKDIASGEILTNAVQAAKSFGSTVGGAMVDEMKVIFHELGLDEMFDKARALVGARGNASSGRAGVNQSDMVDETGQHWDMSGISAIGMTGKMAMAKDILLGDLSSDDNSAAGSARKLGRSLADRGMSDAATRAQRDADGAVKWRNEIRPAPLLEPVKSAFEAIGDALGDAGLSFAENFTSKMGQLGGLINTAINGAKQGGFWAAVGAIIAELLSKAKSFGVILKTANGVVQMLVGAIEPLVQRIVPALQKVLGVLGGSIVPVLEALAPIFGLLDVVLKGIMPVLVMIGQTLRSLAPVFEMVGKALSFAMWTLTPIFAGLFYIIKGITLAILGIMWALGKAFNAITNTTADIVEEILTFISFGDRTWAKAAADKIRGVAIDTSGLDKQIADMVALTFDNADVIATAATDTANSLGDVADAAKEVVDSMTNVPTGFRVALARYGATGDENGNPYGTSSGGGGISIENVTIVAQNIDDFKREMESLRRRKNFQSSGSPMISGLR